MDHELAHAYDIVTLEFIGDGIDRQRVAEVRGEAIEQLGDPRKFAAIVVAAIGDVDWDWPRWHEHADAFGYPTMPQIRARAGNQKPFLGLSLATVAQLKSVLKVQGQSPRSSAKKGDLTKAILALQPGLWEPFAVELLNRQAAVEVAKCRTRMAAMAGTRISHIALARHEKAARLDRGFLALRRYWQFVCGEPGMFFSKPRECRALHNKVLPVAQALTVFPDLPCARLHCMCRIVSAADSKGFRR